MELAATRDENQKLAQRVQTQTATSVIRRRSTGSTKRVNNNNDNGGRNGNTASPRKVRTPSSRLYNPKRNRQKEEQRQKAKIKSELNNCSFKPKISSVGKRAARYRAGASATDRLFQQGVRQLERRAEMASRKGEDEVLDCTFSPNIDKRSARMAVNSPDSGDTFSRLSQPRVLKVNETVRTCFAFRVRFYGVIVVVVAAIVRRWRNRGAEAVVSNTSFLEPRRRGRSDWVPWRGHWFVVRQPAER